VPLDGTLPGSALAELPERSFSVYLHVPFCHSRCGYCDFNTYTNLRMGPGASVDDFPGSLAGEIALSRRVLRGEGRLLDTAFFGGGTPTMLDPGQLGGVLAALDSAFGLRAGAEVTTEANPESVSRDSLLRLAEEVQAFIANGVLSMGQTRPLLALESKTLQREAAEYIQEHELTARGAEALVKRLLKDPNVLKKAAQPAKVRTPDIFVREAEERLTRSLGTKVRIQESREQGKGRLEISYFSADDLERLLALLTDSDSAAKEDKRAALRAISTQSFTV